MLEKKTVKEILNHIKTEEISIKEVIQYYLNNIKKINPIINAIVSKKDEATILRDAENRQREIKEDKPLLGLPMAIKDLSDVVGTPTTYGYLGYKNNIPKNNSFFVNKLIESGVIIIGKTNTAELGVGGQTINRLFGPTSNVYDKSKCAAGSSGGASTAVAAGLLPFADGTDQMGSCRGPAAFANIYGFRPSPGLIASDRAYQHPKIPILTTPGCFSKSPEDMAILLDVITGANKNDPFSFSLQDKFVDTNLSDDQFSNIKIVWFSNIASNLNFEKGITEMCLSKLKDLEKLCKVEMIDNVTNSSDIWESWMCLRAKNIYQDTLNMKINNINDMTPQAIWEYNKGSEVTDENLKEALKIKKNNSSKLDELFKEYDFIVLPSSQVFPFDKTIQYPTKINESYLDTYHRWLEVFVLSSLFDLPTMTIPIGFNSKGYPMGLQVIGKKGDDLRVFSFAKKYEEIYMYSQYQPKF